MRRGFTVFLSVVVIALVAVFVFFKGDIKKLIPKGKESYEQSQVIDLKQKNDSEIIYNMNGMNAKQMHEEFENADILYQVKEAISSKAPYHFTSPKKEDFLYEVEMDDNYQLTDNHVYVTVLLHATNNTEADYTFYLHSAYLKGDKMDLLEGSFSDEANENTEIMIEKHSSKEFYITFVADEKQLIDADDALYLLVDGKGQMLGEEDQLYQVQLKLKQV